MQYYPSMLDLHINAIHHMDALTLLRALPAGSVNACITDPPYAEVDRDYGRLSERDWMGLMQAVVVELRRVLVPSGSAIMVLQPNSSSVGSMRAWLWEFMAWCSREWNVVQDVYWWNIAQPPTVHSQRSYGLMRPSIKPLVWLGAANCYRDQESVLWGISDSTLAMNKSDMALSHHPSGYHMRHGRMAATAIERGGSTPFNILPIPNSNSASSGGAGGHGAATPDALIGWWMRYISKRGDVILDPFMGSGTTAKIADQMSRYYIGCDTSSEYVALARKRLRNADPFQARVVAPGIEQPSLFESGSD